MESQGRLGPAGIDTRALARRIRDAGAPNGVIAHDPGGRFDIDDLLAQARAWPGLEGLDLAKHVSRTDTGDWDSGVWALGGGYRSPPASAGGEGRPHRSEEHTSELQSLMRISYAGFCLKKK